MLRMTNNDIIYVQYNNIRAGNTLVGFATEQELMDGLHEGLFTSQRVQEFKEKTALVAQAFKRFQDAQLVRKPYHEAKADYKRRLTELNEELNQYLAQNYGVDPAKESAYAKWKESHRPFHWFTEFYEIVVNNGGFDVIIGNPPYVEKKTIANIYIIQGYITESTNNLFAYVSERAKTILYKRGNFGFIVPLSSISTDKFAPMQNLISCSNEVWLSNYDDRPARLFDGLEHIQLSIIIYSHNKCQENKSVIHTTSSKKWNSVERPFVFQNLKYALKKKDYISNSVQKISFFVVL